MRNQPSELARVVIDALTTQIAVLDPEGIIIAVNAAWRLFCDRNHGVQTGYYVGLSYLEICERAFCASEDESIGAVSNALREILRGEREQFSMEYPCNSPQEERWFILRITLCDGEGHTRAVVAHENITERKKAENALARADEELRRAKQALETANAELWTALAREQQSARTDELTGASNRRHFFDVASALTDVARRYGQPLSLILFDLDHFKLINDRFGHQAGDEALRHVSRIAAGEVRAADLFARYGGEEFVALLPETGAEEAADLAERIRAAIERQALEWGTQRVPLTVSIGVAAMTNTADSLEDLIRNADKAMYAAKAAGRNRFELAQNLS